MLHAETTIAGWDQPQGDNDGHPFLSSFDASTPAVTRPSRSSTGTSLAALGADPWHARAIAESHDRSRAFGLRAQDGPDLSLLSRAALREAHERNRRLCEHATPVMELLFEQIADARSMVVLTDARGIVLHALGDPVFLDRAHRVALAPGADWSERAKGTNGIGTALIDEAPTLVHGSEHYLSTNRFLTCSAAPIFDHAGGLLGVIDVSGEQRSFHPHTLALARMSARMIEHHWFAERFQRGLRLHFHPSATGLGTVREGVIAFDTDDRVLGANRCAVDLLGRSASWLRRTSVSELFGVSVAQWLDHVRRAPHAPLSIVADGIGLGVDPDVAAPPSTAVWAGDPGEPPSNGPPDRLRQQTFFARLSCEMGAFGPRPARDTATAAPLRPAATTTPAVAAPLAPASSPPPPVRTLAAVEVDTIGQAVQAAGGNISQAARALGIGRNTIYRKLRRSRESG